MHLKRHNIEIDKDADCLTEKGRDELKELLAELAGYENYAAFKAEKINNPATTE